MERIQGKPAWLVTAGGLLAFGVGALIPAILTGVRFEEDSPESQLVLFGLIASVMYVVALFRRIGKMNPRLDQWIRNTLPGTYTLIFVGTLLICTFADLFVQLPLPHWLLWVLIIAIGIGQLWFLVDSDPSRTK